MSYLTVFTGVGPEGLMADRANTFDLSHGKGFFSGKVCPFAHDYFSYLQSEGWELVSSNQINFNEIVYNFVGGRCYEITWNGGNWLGEVSTREDDFGFGDDRGYEEDHGRDDDLPSYTDLYGDADEYNP